MNCQYDELCRENLPIVSGWAVHRHHLFFSLSFSDYCKPPYAVHFICLWGGSSKYRSFNLRTLLEVKTQLWMNANREPVAWLNLVILGIGFNDRILRKIMLRVKNTYPSKMPLAQSSSCFNFLSFYKPFFDHLNLAVRWAGYLET